MQQHPGRCLLCGAVVLLTGAAVAAAQHAPGIGYMFPPGGPAGSTVEVVLGGYDWTPDMQLFVHDQRIELELTGPPGPVIVPEPPYWFGKKARRSPFLLPRETPAKLTIPADVEPGLVRWQAANANGATASGFFYVGGEPEVVEREDRQQPMPIASLPVTVSGRIKHIEQVDRYRFRVPQSGPVTCAVVASQLGSELRAVLEVRDQSGELIADAADTAGEDTALTFAAEANHTYELSIYDVDFRGNRAFVYRLSLTDGPRVVAALPAVVSRGAEGEVELTGYGVATGAAKLESVRRNIRVPADAGPGPWAYRLETPHGMAPPFHLHVSSNPVALEPAAVENETPLLSLPVALCGVIEQRHGVERFRVQGTKGELLSLTASARRIGSPLDLSLAVVDQTGKELARNDDLPETTDAALEWKVPADGEYEIRIGDLSGRSGSRAAVYHLAVEKAQAGFELEAPERINVPIGGQGKLSLKAKRSGGFVGPIAVRVTGLPPGVGVPEELAIAERKNALNIDFTAAEDAAATAAMVTLAGEAKIDDKLVQQSAGPLLLATTIAPPFSVDAEGKDDVTKWPRGTTFPAPVLIERDEGFHEPIVLEMTSKQGRHRQGIRGPELTVPPGVERILYPVFLPEWLETTRTSRMVVNGVAQVADPQGNVRYSLARQKTRMGFLPVGALLTLAAEQSELEIAAGQPFTVELTVSRSEKLSDPVRIELVDGSEQAETFVAEPRILGPGTTQVAFTVTPPTSFAGPGECTLTFRATAMQAGHLPVVSEADVLVICAEAD